MSFLTRGRKWRLRTSRTEAVEGLVTVLFSCFACWCSRNENLQVERLALLNEVPLSDGTCETIVPSSAII